jgi:hypothetical protein
METTLKLGLGDDGEREAHPFYIPSTVCVADAV